MPIQQISNQNNALFRFAGMVHYHRQYKRTIRVNVMSRKNDSTQCKTFYFDKFSNQGAVQETIAIEDGGESM